MAFESISWPQPKGMTERQPHGTLTFTAPPALETEGLAPLKSSGRYPKESALQAYLLKETSERDPENPGLLRWQRQRRRGLRRQIRRFQGGPFNLRTAQAYTPTFAVPAAPEAEELASLNSLKGCPKEVPFQTQSAERDLGNPPSLRQRRWRLRGWRRRWEGAAARPP